jgi:hypothetical protein
MIDRRTFSTMLVAGVATSLFGRSSAARGRLQLLGLTATAVQNPLTSLADDVAATRRILALQDGPTVLVGHSWAGTVISEAGVGGLPQGLRRRRRSRQGACALRGSGADRRHALRLEDDRSSVETQAFLVCPIEAR